MLCSFFCEAGTAGCLDFDQDVFSQYFIVDNYCRKMVYTIKYSSTRYSCYRLKCQFLVALKSNIGFGPLLFSGFMCFPLRVDSEVRW